MAQGIPSQASPQSGTYRQSGKWAGVLAALYILASILAFTQSPRPNPLIPDTLFETFFYPRETNAFARLPVMSGTLNDVFILPGGEFIWAVGADGLLIHSNDGGSSWVRQTYPGDPVHAPAPDITSHLFNKVSLFNRANAAIDNAQAPRKDLSEKDNPKQQSLTNQQSLTEQRPVIPSPQQQTAPADSLNKGAASEGQGLAESAITNLPRPNLHGVAFANERVGIAVGERGTVLKTTDGGQQWELLPLETKVTLRDVAVPSGRKIIISGSDGSIVHSENGGDHWAIAPISKIARSNPTNRLQFLNENLGFAFGGDYAFNTSDGGVTWNTIDTGVIFHATFFNNETGIARRAGPSDKGPLEITTNGGSSWTPLTVPFKDQELGGWDFLDSNNGILISTLGALARTTDGGATWEQFSNLQMTDLREIQFLDNSSLLAWSKSGSVWKSTDGGKSWLPVIHAFNLKSVDFMGGLGIAVGDHGLILRSTDAGDSWQIMPADALTNFKSVAIAKPGSVILSDRRVGLHSASDADQWRESSGDSGENLIRVNLFDDGSAKAISRKGQILTSNDAGKTWQQTSPGGQFQEFFGAEPKHWFFADFVDAGIGINKNRNVLGYSRDGGNTWAPALTVPGEHKCTPDVAMDASWLDKNTVMIVCGNQILTSTDAGINWSTLDLGKPDQIYSAIAFADSASGWVVGANGLVKHTRDGGSSWQEIPSGDHRAFNAVAVSSSDGVIAVGESALLKSSDGGLTWHSPEYAIMPALWYWMATVLLVACALWLFTRTPPAEPDSITNLLASDKPLQSGANDLLDFAKITRGLSGFIRNPGTEPPLTIAITGAWGSGKSSLMNLLYQDLKSFGFTPVWFNAWHHQKGEQLLASLYANIRSQAIPGWFSFWRMIPIGIVFRINLLFRRSAKHRVITLLVIIMVVAAITCMFDSVRAQQIAHIWSQLTTTEFTVEKLLIPLLGGPALLIFRAMRAFGLNPMSLVTAAQGDHKEAQVDPSARQKFAREFNDVVQSLSAGRIVIFIDDLDRCSKENVVDILEAINFLCVSGDCYIVLGMDETWVKICITRQFEEMANNNDNFAEKYLEKMINIKVRVPPLLENHTSNLLKGNFSEKTLPKKFITSFNHKAYKYRHLLIVVFAIMLGVVFGKMKFNANNAPTPEKIYETAITWKHIDIDAISMVDNKTVISINNGVPYSSTYFTSSIPSSSANSTSSMSSSGQPVTQTDIARWELSLQATPETMAQGIVIGKLADGNAQWVLKRIMPRADDVSGSDTQMKAEANTPSNTPSELYSAQTDSKRKDILIILFGGVFIIVSIIIYNIQQQERLTKNSQAFYKALAIWKPWILINRETPRAIKRYLNEIRYMAMYFRPDEKKPETSFIRELKQLLTFKQAGSQEKNIRQFETSLVALSALYQINKYWIINDANFKLVKEKNLDTLVTQYFKDYVASPASDAKPYTSPLDQDEFKKQLNRALQEHLAISEEKFITDDERRKFMEILAGN